jgi:hypothetical protein
MADEPYRLVRVLGNELPPRDHPGSRLSALREVLAREGDLPGARRAWVLNTVHDRGLLDAYRRLLADRGEPCAEVEFDRAAYARAVGDAARVRLAVNVNRARNEAIRIGGDARYTVVLDGDNLFTPEGWSAFRAVADAADRPYYSVPIRRGHGAAPPGEPVLAFRRGAPARFDPMIPFGAGEKVELLVRLGHDPAPCRQHVLLRDDLCKTAGFVVALATGPDDVEGDVNRRMAARAESLARLLEALD